jgi:hypothetical protein
MAPPVVALLLRHDCSRSQRARSYSTRAVLPVVAVRLPQLVLLLFATATSMSEEDRNRCRCR